MATIKVTKNGVVQTIDESMKSEYITVGWSVVKPTKNSIYNSANNTSYNFTTKK